MKVSGERLLYLFYPTICLDCAEVLGIAVRSLISHHELELE